MCMSTDLRFPMRSAYQQDVLNLAGQTLSSPTCWVSATGRLRPYQALRQQLPEDLWLLKAPDAPQGTQGPSDVASRGCNLADNSTNPPTTFPLPSPRVSQR